jgi:thiol-disulfide isomerase/thioredoxin
MVDERTPLLLDVFATWCGPCKLIAPQLEALAAKAGDRCRFAKLDSDAEPQISSELNVQVRDARTTPPDQPAARRQHARDAGTSSMRVVRHTPPAAAARAQGLPTLIFVRDGAEVHRLEGVPGNAAALEALVGQYLGVDF